MPKLFDEDNDNLKIEINNDYAKKYDLWREKEEHQKLKDKYGDLDIEEKCDTLSSSSDTDSELEKDAFDPKIEEEFDNTLKMLKEKNPKIYNNEFQFFNGNKIELNNRQESIDKNIKNSKKMTINDYERHIIQNKGGVYTDDETDEDKNNVKSNTYVQEQKLLKDCFKKAIHPESDNEGEFFKVLPVTKGAMNPNIETECQSVKDSSVFPEYNSLKTVFDKYGIQEDENLKSDRTTCEADNIRPLYESRVSSGDEGEASNYQAKPTQQQHRYRFREIEEKEANGPNNVIASFPRILPPEVSSSLLRKPKPRNEKRKAQREARFTKKKAEKIKILEETKRLRSLKLQTIRRKVSKLEKVSGLSHLDSLLTLEDIEKDYDPEKFDRMINRMFDEKYYEDDKRDIKKPLFNDTDDEIDDMKENRLSNFNSEGNTKTTEIIQGKLSGNKNDETRKELESLKSDLDQYLNLNFSGIVAGKPTRFKYRKVVPNQFGLTTDEILGADDKELNKWVSLKKMVQYRTDQEEKFDLHAYDIKGKQFFKKKKILTSMYAPKPKTLTENTQSEDENNGGKFTTTFVLKTNDVKKLCANDSNNLNEKVLDVDKCKPERSTDRELEENKIQSPDEKKLTQNLTIDKKVKKFIHDPKLKTSQLIPSDQRLLLYGINPKVYKKKLKYKQVKKNVT